MAGNGQRRSARISALEAARDQQQAAGGPGDKGKQIVVWQGQDSNSVQELPVRKRGRKKRKLRTVEEVVVSSVERTAEQATEIPKHEDHPSNTIRPSTLPSASQKSEKQLFELIIDILQTRDSHDVFAEPVPEDVEHYYEIIKQPMDFHTMKTKLQNGMYTTLEEFKNDVLLISNNAMHFNGQNTFYFRQGQANYQLAEKIFDAVKANPGNYEEVLLRLRSKVGKQPGRGSRRRRATNETPNGMNNGAARRGRPCLYGPSSLARNIQSSNPLVDRNDYENLFGARDGRRSNFFEEESRRMSKPWNSFLSPYESIASTIYESSKQLVNVNGGGIGYEESLLRYVKDLGPTAQKIAKQKLLAYQNSAPNGQIASTSTQRRLNPPNNIINPTSQNLLNNFSGLPTVPNPPNNVINISTSQNFFNNFSALPAVPNPPNSVINIPPSQNFLNNFSSVPTVQSALPNTGDKFDFRGAFRGETSHQNQSSEIQVGSHFLTTSVKDLKFPVNGMENSGNGYFSTVDSVKFDNNNPSAELASEMSQSKLLEYICRKNDISRSSSSGFQAMMDANSSRASSSRHDLGSQFGTENQAITTPGSSYRVSPVPKWNQSSLVSHSLGVEQNQARVAPGPTYGTSSTLFGHGMEWNGPSFGSNSFGGENLVMAAQGPSCAVGSPEADQVLEWNRANSGSHSLSAGNQAMDEAGAVYGINSAQASLGSHSFSAGNQEMGAAGVVYGTKSAQASPVPDWNQHNLGSPFLGGENQAMDVSGGGYGVELTQGDSVPVPIPIPVLEWNQQRAFASQAVIDMEYLQKRLSEMNAFDQNGFFQPEWRLGSEPEAGLLGQMGFCGRAETHGQQAELSTLALLDNHQQPDLALQL